MSDDLGIRKLGRRRKTTRRLTRRGIRVPGDDVPRQSVSAEADDDGALLDDDAEVGGDAEGGDAEGGDTEGDMQASAEQTEPGERRSADLLDVDLELDVEEPSSGVMHAPPAHPQSDPAALAARSTESTSSPPTAAARGSVAVAPLMAAVRVSPPPPAGPSEPPPAGAVVPIGTEPSALRASMSAAASGHAPSLRGEEGELDAATNPQIRLSELAPRRTSVPAPAVRDARSSDVEELTRPRIEIPHDVAMAAGRVTSLEMPPVGDDVDVDTNPRGLLPLGLSYEDERPVIEALPPVIVTRARVISDAPGALPEPEATPTRVSLETEAKHSPEEEIEALDLDEGEGDEDPRSLEIPSGLMPGAAAQLRADGRPSKAPPPPPPDISAKALPKKPALPSQAASPPPSVAAKPPPPPPPAAPKKPAAKAQPKRRYWWEDFFSDDYLHSVRRPSTAQIAKQVDFIEQSLSLNKGDAVLDVGCGLGLHSLELARRGYLVVGIDLSLPMITRAAEEAQQEGLRINFMHSDAREMAFTATFDAVICVGTTFGFFDEDTNRDVLARMGQALKPGGRLLLDVVNRDYVVRSQPNLVWFEGDGCVVMEESDFNYFTSRLTVKRTMMRDDGRQSDAEYSIRLYSLHELGLMVQQAGFWVKEVSGQEATRGVFFGSHSTRLMLLGERRSGKPNGGGADGEREPTTGEMSKPG